MRWQSQSYKLGAVPSNLETHVHNRYIPFCHLHHYILRSGKLLHRYCRAVGQNSVFRSHLMPLDKRRRSPLSSCPGPVHCRLRFERKSFVHRNLVFCFDSIHSTRFLQRSRIYLPSFIQGSYPHERGFGSHILSSKFAEIGSFYARVQGRDTI